MMEAILIVLLIIGGLIGLAAYFAPSIIAIKRDHRSKLGIIALNVLLGWSLLGWIIALIWSLSDAGNRS